MYVDGEDTPSIQFTPPLACGTGFNDDQGAWATSLFGKGSSNGGWHSNMRIPFTKSINITLQAGAGMPDDVFYMIARGGEDVPITVGGVPVPLPGSKLVLQTQTLTNMKPLDFATVAYVPAGTGSGLLLQHTLSFSAPNLNTLEGCYHAYTSQTGPAFPGTIVSTGTEDFFTSAYYFSGCGTNGGPTCHFETMGLTHFKADAGSAQVSAYRSFHTDLFPFSAAGGLNLTWRNGDVTDPATGLKCTSLTGNTVGSPGPANVTTYSWVYIFA